MTASFGNCGSAVQSKSLIKPEFFRDKARKYKRQERNPAPAVKVNLWFEVHDVIYHYPDDTMKLLCLVKLSLFSAVHS